MTARKRRKNEAITVNRKKGMMKNEKRTQRNMNKASDELGKVWKNAIDKDGNFNPDLIPDSTPNKDFLVEVIRRMNLATDKSLENQNEQAKKDNTVEGVLDKISIALVESGVVTVDKLHQNQKTIRAGFIQTGRSDNEKLLLYSTAVAANQEDLSSTLDILLSSSNNKYFPFKDCNSIVDNVDLYS